MMMNSIGNKIILGTLVAVFLLAYFFLFTVDERQLVVRKRFGEIERTDFAPGLHFTVPIYYTVQKFDKRIHTADQKPERFLTIEKKNVIVDSFIKWRIGNIRDYYTSVAGNTRVAGDRIGKIINDVLKNHISVRTIKELLSDERSETIRDVMAKARQKAMNLGLEVVDIRIKRIDFPEDVNNSVYERMTKERATVAKEFRSRGLQRAQEIRAETDREYTEILADAYRKAEVLRGEGDAESASIYAKAYSLDASFFSFYRSLRAYQKSFEGEGGDYLVIEPNSEFFKHFPNSRLK